MTPKSTAFSGWSDEAVEFYEGLEADNSKAYWDPRKSVYEQSVKAPMDALVTELEPEFGEFHIMRPYRDIRFSTDKSPYKPFIGAGSQGIGGGVYVSFSGRGLFAGAGSWHLSKDQLVRFRAALDGPAGGELEAITAELGTHDLELEGETLKRSPKGYPADHPRVKLLRHTSVVTGRHWAPAPWMATAQAKDRVVEVWNAARPLNTWLDEHVGAAESPMR